MTTIAAILVNYNHSEFLEEAIKSLLKQILQFDEIIIVDDNSTDNSISVIERLANKNKKIKLLVNKKNEGVIFSANRALKYVESDFVYFASSNDTYSKHIVSEAKRLIQMHPTVKMVSGGIELETKLEKFEKYELPFDKRQSIVWPSEIRDRLIEGSFSFLGGGNVMHTKTIGELGIINTELEWHADWLLYLIISLKHPIAVTKISFTKQGYSKNRYSSAMKNIFKQKSVTIATLDILKAKFPKEYELFILSATVAYPRLSTFVSILMTRGHIRFITLKLFWRCVIFTTLSPFGGLLAPDTKTKLRRRLRV